MIPTADQELTMMLESDEEEQQSMSKSAGKHKYKFDFPFKLHSLLDYVEKNGREDIVRWVPTVKEQHTFQIVNARAFEDEILPMFFGSGKFRSFQRQLSIYGFKRSTTKQRSPLFGAYYHPCFIRGQPALCHNMERVKVKEQGSKKESQGLKRKHNMSLFEQLSSSSLSTVPVNDMSMNFAPVPAPLPVASNVVEGFFSPLYPTNDALQLEQMNTQQQKLIMFQGSDNNFVKEPINVLQDNDDASHLEGPKLFDLLVEAVYGGANVDYCEKNRLLGNGAHTAVLHEGK